MIVTARQLAELHKAAGGNGQVVLPYRARLSPLAADWIRARKIAIGYGDPDGSKPSAPPAGAAGSLTLVEHAPPVALPYLWWCDGPCGPAKAAVAMQSRESALRAIDLPADAKQLVPVLKALATDVKAGRAAGGILIVQAAAAAVVLANRCPSLRAITGTCLDAVEQGVKFVAANVLVVEHPYLTMAQVRNLLARFVRGPRELSENVKRQLAELASCA